MKRTDKQNPHVTWPNIIKAATDVTKYSSVPFQEPARPPAKDSCLISSKHEVSAGKEQVCQGLFELVFIRSNTSGLRDSAMDRGLFSVDRKDSVSYLCSGHKCIHCRVALSVFEQSVYTVDNGRGVNCYWLRTPVPDLDLTGPCVSFPERVNSPTQTQAQNGPQEDGNPSTEVGEHRTCGMALESREQPRPRAPGERIRGPSTSDRCRH
ncbi:Protein Heg-like 1 [Manis pentadactyla]|nr:Protein Heg-like 1 [Manis pentadactyla]